MSGQLRALRNRIRSVENTKKITRAMEMVAAAKLRRFQDMMQKSRAYTQGLESLLVRVSKSVGRNTRRKETSPFFRLGKRKREVTGTFYGLGQKSSLSPLSHPFIVPREEKKIALVLMTSDAGLCGSYNNDLISMAREFVQARRAKPVLIGVGKSGITAAKSLGVPCRHAFTDLRASRVEEILAELRRVLEKMYLDGEVDSIYVTYSHFKNVTTYKPVTEKLLPLEVEQGTGYFSVTEKEAATSTFSGLGQKSSLSQLPNQGRKKDWSPLPTQLDYIFEPSPEVVFKRLVPQFFEAKVRLIFLEAIVSEQIARMTAMNLATKNAKEMIDSLVLQRNKARQASITKELIEIVSGSQALKLK